MTNILFPSKRLLRQLAALLLFASALQAQHVLYNQKQDQTAQDAVTAAKQVTGGALFDTMIANLDLQARQETDTVLAYTREILRSRLVMLTDAPWGPAGKVPVKSIPGLMICESLACKLTELEETLRAGSLLDSPGDTKTAAQRLQEITTKSGDLQTVIKNLRAASTSKDPVVIELLSHLGDAKDVVGYANQVAGLTTNKGLGQSLDEISKGLDQAITLYNSVKTIWAGYEAVKVNPSTLRPPREVTELQLLGLEEQHIKNLARIRAVEHLEAGDVLTRVISARQFLGDAAAESTPNNPVSQLTKSELIDVTVRGAAVATADRARLRKLLLGLLEAAAAFASNDSVVRMELTREGQEERLYSIRRSTINSSTYDQTIRAAVQRLGIYYKGGIKPSDIAGLIYFISNSAAVSAIAVK